MKITINSQEEMQNLGRIIAKTAQPHDLLLLNGDLGAGKTTMTQGIGRQLKIKRPVKSPTFTLVREYQEGTMPLYHMDFYRIEGDDLAGIDLADYLSDDGLVVIEWPDVISEHLPADYLELQLKRVDNDWNSTVRTVEFLPRGERNENWVKAIKEQL